jgi:hypothetical protein
MKELFVLFISILIGLLLTVSSHAELIDRGCGMIYDTVLNITWLQDANYARTSGYDSDGQMYWEDAKRWVENLVYRGYSDWRLPRTLPINGTSYSYDDCSWLNPCLDGLYDAGCYNITSPNHEMAYMYYVNLGNKAYPWYENPRHPNCGPFKFPDGPPLGYWSGSKMIDHPDYPPPHDIMFDFSFFIGYQGGANKYYERLYVWPVRDGDVVCEQCASVGETIYYSGSVQIIRENNSTYVKNPWFKLCDDDMVVTLDGNVDMRIGKSTVSLGSSSTLKIDKAPTGKTSTLELFKGRLFEKIRSLPSGETYEIRTPVCVTGVRGTEVIVETTNDETRIIVLEDQADIYTIDGTESIVLQKLQGVIVTAEGIGDPFPVSPHEIDRWWERMVISVASPIDLYVTDPLGRHIGRNPEWEIVNEIPGATYTGPDAVPEEISIPNPAEGSYEIDLLAVGSGPYDLSVTGMGLGNGSFLGEFSGSIETDQVVSYQASYGQALSMTVTTSSDALNGDCSSVDNLIDNPGADGISLREAITASNNTPGPEHIQFAPELTGTSIYLFSTTSDALPILTGGSLTINGDIDGDGHPDVAIDGSLGEPDTPTAHFLSIWSDNNTITGLIIKNFGSTISFAVPGFWNGPSKTISGNRILGNIIKGGIGIGPLGWIGVEDPERISNLTWRETEFSGNEVDEGILLYAGAGSSYNNQIIATIITGNRLAEGTGITVLASDTNTVWQSCPGPIWYADGNLVEDLVISNNQVNGIGIEAANMGNRRNQIRNVRIYGNEVGSGGINIITCADVEKYDERKTSDNLISEVEIRENTVEGATCGICAGASGGNWGVDGPGMTENRLEEVIIANNTVIGSNWAGIAIWGGLQSGVAPIENNLVSGVRISDNQVLSQMPLEAIGILLVGGWFQNWAIGAVTGNTVTGVEVTGNEVVGYRFGMQVLGGCGQKAESNAVEGIAHGNILLENGYPFQVSDNHENAVNNSVAFTVITDSDGDGMSDDWEVANELDPSVDDSGQDPDEDGLSNLAEYQNGTDPNESDTDNDAMTDGWEVSYGLNPLVDDASEDLDGDGYSNLEEYTVGTYPNDYTDTLKPNQPVLFAPADGTIDLGLTPELQTEAFSDPDRGDTHSKTQWQISMERNFSSLLLDITASSHLASITVPDAILEEGTIYYWRVRFYDNHDAASGWSNAFSFTTLTTQQDADANDIPDDQEVDNTVDLDNNGTPDNEQADIMCVRTAVGDGQIGVKIAANCTTIDCLQSIDPDTITDTTNRPEELPLGLISFKVTVNTPGATAEVIIYLSEPAASSWYKYDTINGWQDYSAHATFSTEGTAVTLELKDGGFGDADGAANGIIVDPSGLAGATIQPEPSPEPIPESSGGGGGGGGGCFISVGNGN